MSRARNKPLTVTVSRDGVLRIEIGIDTNAYATLHSEYAYSLMGPDQHRPDSRFSIKNARGFANDVKRELLREAEDGSSLLSNMLDKASQNAIEDGSLYFIDGEDLP